MDSFIFYELEYKKHPCKNGEYINIDNIIPDKNTIFTYGSIIIGIYIVDFFNEEIFNKEVIDILKKDCKMHNNRADFSGIIDKDKLYKSYHKYINEYTKYNKNNTRIEKNNNCKYSFSNGCRYTVLNEKKKYYIENKKTIHELIDTPIIKPINKILNHFFDLDNKNNIFGFWNEMIINKSIISAVHSDSNNANELSCLISLSTDINKLPISYLNLVDYNISIPMQSNKSILIMNLKEIRHSNNHIEKEALNTRISIVLYNK
jgi:hypothetical protein